MERSRKGNELEWNGSEKAVPYQERPRSRRSRCNSRPEGDRKERQCLNHGGGGNTQGKGSVLTTEAVETHKAKAVS